MIECTYQVLAVFLVDVEKGEHTAPVLAWDDTGQAMVLGDKALVLASSFAGFAGLRMASDVPQPDPRAESPVVIKPRRQDGKDKP